MSLTVISIATTLMIYFLGVQKRWCRCFFLRLYPLPDLCEKNFDQAYNINVTNTILHRRFFIVKGVKVIFSSSDAVFGFANELVLMTRNETVYRQWKMNQLKSFEGNENFFVVRFSVCFSQKMISFLMVVWACRIRKTLMSYFDLNATLFRWWRVIV